MTASQRLFLDASVLIAASASRTGASSLVLTLCRHGRARPVCSRKVLLEAERNTRAKLGRQTLLRFYQEIASLHVDIVDDPTPREITAHAAITHPKDAHVLAGAVKGRADVLLTLDRRHLLVPTVLQAGLPFLIMTPGEWLRRLVE